MKQLYFLFFSLFCINSQALDMLKEHHSWNYQACSWGNCWNVAFKIEGDTTINSKKYMRVFETRDSTLSNWNASSFMREESSKVYQYNTYKKTEELILDFNLQVTDSFYFASCGTKLPVDSIDTVKFSDGIKRKRIIFGKSQWNQEIWIEGIGSSNGLTNPSTIHCIADYGITLNCFATNGDNLFKSETLPQCLNITVNTTKFTSKNLGIQPNPFNEELTFNVNEPNWDITLFNALGNVVYSKKNIKSPQYTLPTNSISVGVYFFQIVIGSDVLKGKVVKVQ